MASRTDIPIGRTNSISRSELAHLWRMDDRGVRKAIAALRAEADDSGFVILSTSHNPSGYWRSNDPTEIREFIRETEARARNTFLSIKAAKDALQRAERDRAYGLPLVERAAYSIKGHNEAN